MNKSDFCERHFLLFTITVYCRLYQLLISFAFTGQPKVPDHGQPGRCCTLNFGHQLLWIAKAVVGLASSFTTEAPDGNSSSK